MQPRSINCAKNKQKCRSEFNNSLNFQKVVYFKWGGINYGLGHFKGFCVKVLYLTREGVEENEEILGI